MCSTTRGLAEEMVQETFIKFCPRAGDYAASRGPVQGWLFAMARPVAYDIARRPSSRPFLPAEDFQAPPQYDTAAEALTTLTVDQALDKLPSIYSDVMRLIRDGDHEIAGAWVSRSGRSNPGWPRRRHVTGRLASGGRLCFLSGTSSGPPEAFDFAWGNMPRRRASSPAISAVAATARASSTTTARSAGSSRTFRRTSSRQLTLKSGRSLQWSLPWLSREPSQFAALTPRTLRTKPPPAATRFQRFIFRPSPRPSSTHRSSAGRHSPACVATLPRPYRRCRCRRCHHHCPPSCSRSALAGDGSPRFKPQPCSRSMPLQRTSFIRCGSRQA